MGNSSALNESMEGLFESVYRSALHDRWSELLAISAYKRTFEAYDYNVKSILKAGNIAAVTLCTTYLRLFGWKTSICTAYLILEHAIAHCDPSDIRHLDYGPTLANLRELSFQDEQAESQAGQTALIEAVGNAGQTASGRYRSMVMYPKYIALVSAGNSVLVEDPAPQAKRKHITMGVADVCRGVALVKRLPLHMRSTVECTLACKNALLSAGDSAALVHADTEVVRCILRQSLTKEGHDL